MCSKFEWGSDVRQIDSIHLKHGYRRRELDRSKEWIWKRTGVFLRYTDFQVEGFPHRSRKATEQQYGEEG
jgi:hypothetical protein